MHLIYLYKNWPIKVILKDTEVIHVYLKPSIVLK